MGGEWCFVGCFLFLFSEKGWVGVKDGLHAEGCLSQWDPWFSSNANQASDL